MKSIKKGQRYEKTHGAQIGSPSRSPLHKSMQKICHNVKQSITLLVVNTPGDRKPQQAPLPQHVSRVAVRLRLQQGG